MKNTVIILTLFFFIFILLGQSTCAQNFAWAAQNGTPNNFDDAKAIGTDAAGNVYVLGAFRDSIDLDPGVADVKVYGSGIVDIYVQKLDPVGNHIWAFSIGGPTIDQPQDIHVQPNGEFFITGQLTGTVDMDPGVNTTNLTSTGAEDIFYAKYTSSGGLVFAKNVGGAGADVGRSIVADGSGNIYLGGSFTGSADMDPGVGTVVLNSTGFADLFVAKYDPSGNSLWAFGVGGTLGGDIVQSITLSNSGNVLVSGYFNGNGVDFDPGNGTLALSTNGFADIFVASYTTAGAFNWAKSIGSIDDDMGFGIVADASGNAIVAGYFQGSATDFDPGAGTFPLTAADNDIFLLKLDANGNFVWAKQMGGPTGDVAYNLAIDAMGDLYITGYFTGIPDFDPDAGVVNLIGAGLMDIYIASYNSSGAINWVRGTGSSTADMMYGICTDALNNVYTCGTFTSTIDANTDVVGSYYFTSLGARDAIVHKIGVTTTGSSVAGALGVEVYPNPSNGIAHLKLDKHYSSIDISISDITGKIIEKRTEYNKGFLQLDLSDLSPGTYFLKLNSEEGIAVTKLVKQ